MAAPFILRQRLSSLLKTGKTFEKLQHETSKCSKRNLIETRHYSSSGGKSRFNGTNIPWSSTFKSTFGCAALVFGGGYVLRNLHLYKDGLKVHANSVEEIRPKHEPSRQVIVETDTSGLKLTLYQIQTCPFCCKTRAFLDYNGFSYDVIEVNSVSKKQLKWSEYKKVPILVVEQNGVKQEVPIRDSSVIISVLESYLQNTTKTVETFNSYYPMMEDLSGNKKKWNIPNRYFVMYEGKTDLGSTPEQRVEERKWRKWADDHLVHMLSPNAYRTPSEALQTFNHFSDAGDWENNHSWWERLTVIYLGATVMYILGKWLKRKYQLKADVRESLYDACDEWVKAVGKKRPFMGGNAPNLADLSVFGVLHSIDGTAAWQDTLANSKIGPWYKRTRDAVNQHHGSSPFNKRPLPSDKTIIRDIEKVEPVS